MLFLDLRSARWPIEHIFFCDRHAEIPEVLQFFRDIFAQLLRDLDARRAIFGFEQGSDLHKIWSDVKHMFLQRTMAEYTQFFLRKARRISEILQFFRGILAQNWRDLDAARLLFSDLNA